ncbi:MAG TPA: DUF6599 family protein [Candidatus Acidoferrum sp.]|nr:DUF6599 family protein [Candidatus Acidoferrum sp.]
MSPSSVLPRPLLPRLLLIVLLLLAPSLRADSVLPSHFGKWTASNAVQSAAIPAHAKDVLAESGLESAETRGYANGSTAITITTYRLHDSSGAYEAYTFFQEPKNDCPQSSALKPCSAPVDASSEKRRVALLENILVIIDNAGSLSADDQDALSKQINAKADKTPPPPIPNYLPTHDVIPGTEKYALGPAAFRAALSSLNRAEYRALSDAAGFSSGAEAMFAQYQNNRDVAVVLLIDYPTPQLAGLHWKHLEQALPPSAKSDGTSIERKGTLLAIVLAPSSRGYAARVRDAVNYETQVTWNEPTHTITDPPITTVLAKIIIATGVFMLVAIVFGVAFGGVRVLMKSLFPGKVFDRPEQMDVLQLGLSGKRINSRDFY